MPLWVFYFTKMKLKDFFKNGFTYIYRGDRMTDPKYKMQPCNAVLNEKGKCIRGKNSNMLVEFSFGKANVLARQLRRIDKLILKEN